MKLFDWIFRKNAIEDIPPLPSWETLIEMMHDKNLDAFADEVIEVVYSIDKSMRYVILKNDKGFFTYTMRTTGNIFVCTITHYLQCGSRLEALKGNRYLTTLMNSKRN